MSLLDPIIPYLGPLGPALAVSGTLVVILGLIGIVSFMLYKVKRDIFETSVGWVGATVVLSLITILFRGMTYLCGCAWYYDTGGNPTALVPLTYMLITGSFFAIIYNFNIPPLKKHKWLISIPLSVPIAIVSNLFFPLVENGISSTPPLVFIEIAFLAPLGAIYSSFVYERASSTWETITQDSDASWNKARKARKENQEAQSYHLKNRASPTSHTDFSDEE